jgi:putative MATE family efflux protein
MRALSQDSGFYKSMARLALPIAVQNLLMAAFHLIDSSMVAQFGDAALAGVGMAGRWSFIMMITLFGINSGAAILYSQYKGANDQDGIRRVFGFTLVNTMGIVTIFWLGMFLFPRELIGMFTGSAEGKPAETAAIIAETIRLGSGYLQIVCFNGLIIGFNFSVMIMLRSTEEVKIPLYASLLSVVVNTTMNYMLIYGNFGMPKLGVQGAAIATLISSFVQMIVLVIALRCRRHPVFAHGMRGLFAFTKTLAQKFYRVASPVIFNEVFWSLGTSVYMLAFGHAHDKTGVPAYVLYSGIDQLLFAFVIGMASACGVMVGKAVGAGEPDRAWRYAKRFLLLGMVFAMGMTAVEILLRVPLINLINPSNPQTGELAKRLLLIGSFGLPLRMLSMLLIVSIFRSGGKPIIGALIDVGCVWLVGAPAVLLAAFVFQLPFIWIFAIMFIEEIVKVAVGLVFFFRRKWIQNLTEDTAVPAMLPEEAGAR